MAQSEAERLETMNDQALEDLVAQVSLDVKTRETQLNLVRNEIAGLQSEIKTQQEIRKELTLKYFKVDEVSPLVNQSIELRQNLAEKQRLYETIAQNSSQNCSEIRELERKAAEAESKVQLEKMEAENKENMDCIRELQESYASRRKKQEILSNELAQLQGRLLEYRSARAKTAGSSKKRDINSQLDKFIRRTCKNSGLHLRDDKSRPRARARDETKS